MTTFVEVSPETLRWSAEQVIRQHREPADETRATGRCQQCSAAGCTMLAWAAQYLGVVDVG